MLLHFYNCLMTKVLFLILFFQSLFYLIHLSHSFTGQ